MTLNKSEIDQAIGAHGMWTARLKMAIASGTSDTPIETIRKDTECAFGRWLHGPGLAEVEKEGLPYREVRDLHARFHEFAAQVAEFAQAGKQNEAEQMMATGGAFTEASRRLTQAMVAWRKLIL
jgi:Chemoreceptor zinc-binding domain